MAKLPPCLLGVILYVFAVHTIGNAKADAKIDTFLSPLCGSGFVMNSNGICAVGHGDSCDNSTALCDEAAFLVCDSSKKCECANPEKTVYDEKAKICKIKANQECANGEGSGVQPCAEFSACSPFTTGKLLCECLMDYEESNGECFLPYYGECNKNGTAPCNSKSFMECKLEEFAPGTSYEGCFCAADANVGYELETNSCVLLDGANCSRVEGSQPCAEKADCREKNPGQGNFQCACVNSTVKQENRFCAASFGSKCGFEGNGTCRAESFLECDPKLEECACDPDNSDLWYDNTSLQCALLAGSKCTQDENSNPCVYQSQCDPKDGVCKCIGPLQPSSKSRRCFIPYQKPCNYTTEARWGCNQDERLTCLPDSDFGSSTCQCPDTRLREDDTCKVKAGGLCLVNNDGWQCVKNSVCHPDKHVCTCEGDLVASSDGICALPYNATCNNANPIKCDSAGFQTCGPNQVCACTDPIKMYYDSYKSQCSLKMGQPCNNDESPQCGNSMFCNPQTSTCGCDEFLSLVDNHNGACVKKFGTKCSTTNLPDGYCDPIDYLTCTQDYFYNLYCLCNKHTTQKGNGTTARCVKNMHVTCDPKDEPNGHCNADEYLICKDKSCECDGDHFNSTEYKCVGNLGAPCKSDENCNVIDELTTHCDLVSGTCKSSGAFRFHLDSVILSSCLILWVLKSKYM